MVARSRLLDGAIVKYNANEGTSSIRKNELDTKIRKTHKEIEGRYKRCQRAENKINVRDQYKLE